MWVCLFDDEDVEETEVRHELTEQTLGIWHGAVPGIARGQRYGFRADGPWDPEAGLRFNPAKLLLDPYALAVSGRVHQRAAGVRARPHRRRPGPTALVRDDRDSAPHVAKGVVVHDDFDWGGDRPMQRRWRDTVIYELHVKGFTQLHDRIPEELRGTYAGLGHHVVTDYLTDLGVTAVELLPIHEFVSEPHLRRHGLTNYWGYNSIGYFAPHSAYSSSGDRGQQVTEFKQMVKNLHDAGIEVILDVVYNHTAEAGADGPTLSFRGLDDLGYYQRVSPDPRDRQPAGHLLGHHRLRQHRRRRPPRGAAADPGLAALLGHRDARRRLPVRPGLGAGPHRPRDRHGLPLPDHDRPGPRAAAREADRRAVGHLDGRLPCRRVPAAVGGVERPVPRHDARLLALLDRRGAQPSRPGSPGSSDLYLDDGRSPYASINFITAHDGFTLRDLVSYDVKHNEANREDNRDGTDNNRSWNCGVEGETDDADVIALRHRQAANLIATLCLSNGVPMLTAGDERGRTQRRQQQRLQPGQRDLLGRLATRRRLARHLRHHPGGAADPARAPGAAAAALVRGAADDRRRTQGPGLDPPRGPRDDRRRLAGRRPARGRHVRLRRPTPLPRPPRRAAARQQLPALAQRLPVRLRDHLPAERVGPARRRRPLHRPRQPDRRPGLAPARRSRSPRGAWCCCSRSEGAGFPG